MSRGGALANGSVSVPMALMTEVVVGIEQMKKWAEPGSEKLASVVQSRYDRCYRIVCRMPCEKREVPTPTVARAGEQT